MSQILSTDTVWASGATITLTGNIQIAPGATLTIQPGVTVLGNGFSIQTFGTLDAAGAPGSPVNFENTKFILSANYAQPGTMSIDNAVLNGGSFLAPTGNGSYGAWSITNSTLIDLPAIYVWYPTGNILIQHDYFENSGGLSIGTDGTVHVTIDHDTFAGWTGAIYTKAAIENWASYGSSSTVVSNNNFLDAGKIALALPPNYDQAAMSATGNYFGTTDPAVIASMIYDQHVDLNSAGAISNSSIQASAVSGAPTTPACFAEGTLLLTDVGARPVESLAPGMILQTVDQGFQPVIWVGRREVDCSRHPQPKNVWPVYIRANAFDAGCPSRDLWLSPCHSVFVDDVLVPVRLLMNGVSIYQVPVDAVTYYHVELPFHAVVLSEDLPTESYLDVQARGDFENAGVPMRLHPDFGARIWDALGCAPIHVVGEKVERLHNRLLERALKLPHVRSMRNTA